MMRLLTQALSVLVLLGICVWATAAEIDNRDTIERTDGKTVRAYIVNETLTNVVYSANKDGGAEQEIPWNEVKDVTYNAMSGGIWTGPQQSAFNGDYTEAIKQLSGLAGVEKSGDKWRIKVVEDFNWNNLALWKRAYGLFSLGQVLEQSGQRAEAAQVFGILAEKLPEHHLSVYAVYRQGVNTALSGGDAKPMQEALKKYTNASPEIGLLVTDLDRALSVIIEAGSGDYAAAERNSGRLRMRFRDNLEDWLYWRELWASILVEHKDFDKAEMIYSEIYDKMENNPKRRARAAMLLGRCLDAAGKTDDAMIYFMQLNALPLVGKTDLAEARYHAAGIFLKRSESAEADEKTRLRELAQGLYGAVVHYAPLESGWALKAQVVIDEQFPTAESSDAAKTAAEANADDGSADDETDDGDDTADK